MKTRFVHTGFWRLALLAVLLALLSITVVSAQSPVPSTWVTVCHVPPGQPEAAQTMQIHWAALDKCLSHFGDYLGPCIQ